MKLGNRAVLLIFIALLVDQILKIYIKTNFAYRDSIEITDWFILYFIENDGMAFGLTFGGEYGKLILSVFRIVAVGFIAYYLFDLIRKKVPPGFIFSISLIFAGAMGNILDSAFYGLIFDTTCPCNMSDFSCVAQNPYCDGNIVSQFVAPGNGYQNFLFGKVVDMLYFPLYEGYLPSWIPIWGGDYFIFFQPVFNLADSYITIGVSMIILFQKRYFKPKEEAKTNSEQDLSKTDTVEAMPDENQKEADNKNPLSNPAENQ